MVAIVKNLKSAYTTVLIKDCREYGPSFVVTSGTGVDGDTHKYIMPQALLLAVLYIALALTLLFHTSKYNFFFQSNPDIRMMAMRRCASCFVNTTVWFLARNFAQMLSTGYRYKLRNNNVSRETNLSTPTGKTVGRSQRVWFGFDNVQRVFYRKTHEILRHNCNKWNIFTAANI